MNGGTIDMKESCIPGMSFVAFSVSYLSEESGLTVGWYNSAKIEPDQVDHSTGRNSM